MKLLKNYRPDLEKYWSKENSCDFNNATIGERSVVKWRCLKGHSFNKEIKRVSSNKIFKCEDCIKENSIGLKYPELKEYYSTKDNKFSIENLQSETTPIWWILSCKHKTKRTVKSIIESMQCYNCSPEKLRKKRAIDVYPEIDKYWAKENNQNFRNISSWDETRYYWVCKNNHLELKTIYQKAVLRPHCRLCTKGATSDIPEDSKIRYDEVKNKQDKRTVSLVSKRKYWWICNYDHSFQYPVKTQYEKEFEYCTECQKFDPSTLEVEVRSYISEIYKGIIVYNYKEISNVSEVDIYLPELGIAFEVNGEYWHSNKIARKNGWNSAKQKHKHKKDNCLKSSVRLYFIWEDDWRLNKESTMEEIQNAIKDFSKDFRLLNRLESNRDKIFN